MVDRSLGLVVLNMFMFPHIWNSWLIDKRMFGMAYTELIPYNHQPDLVILQEPGEQQSCSVMGAPFLLMIGWSLLNAERPGKKKRSDGQTQIRITADEHHQP